MSLVPKVIVRFLSLLLIAALATGPIVVFAKAGAVSTSEQDATAMNVVAPCEMPCNDCGDAQPSPECVIACAGLASPALLTAAGALPMAPAAHAPQELSTTLSGREREPDEPPPKLILA